MPSAICPHCEKPAHITCFPMYYNRKDSLVIWFGQRPAQDITDELLLKLAIFFKTLEGDLWRIGRCENCKQPVFVILSPDEETVQTIYPTYRGEPHPDITKEQVAQDYVEAKLCLSVGAFKGAAVLCRRAMQGAAIDKGAKKDTLFDQLDELVASGDLTPKLAKLAQNVRQLTTYGAHPGKDGLDEVTTEEAEAICDLTWQILEHLYVVPAKSARIEEAIEGKKKREKQAEAKKAGKQVPEVD